jgi:hypothetical protein
MGMMRGGKNDKENDSTAAAALALSSSKNKSPKPQTSFPASPASGNDNDNEDDDGDDDDDDMLPGARNLIKNCSSLYSKLHSPSSGSSTLSHRRSVIQSTTPSSSSSLSTFQRKPVYNPSQEQRDAALSICRSIRRCLSRVVKSAISIEACLRKEKAEKGVETAVRKRDDTIGEVWDWFKSGEEGGEENGGSETNHDNQLSSSTLFDLNEEEGDYNDDEEEEEDGGGYDKEDESELPLSMGWGVEGLKPRGARRPNRKQRLDNIEDGVGRVAITSKEGGGGENANAVEKEKEDDDEARRLEDDGRRKEDFLKFTATLRATQMFQLFLSEDKSIIGGDGGDAEEGAADLDTSCTSLDTSMDTSREEETPTRKSGGGGGRRRGGGDQGQGNSMSPTKRSTKNKKHRNNGRNYSTTNEAERIAALLESPAPKTKIRVSGHRTKSGSGRVLVDREDFN